MIGGSPGKLQNKQIQRVGKGAGTNALVSDIGIVKKGTNKGQSGAGSSSQASTVGGKSASTASGDGLNNSQNHLMEDSFEKFYNKDLDLEEDQVPVVIYELNESAINFISQEQYEKALILLQKAQTMLDQI